MDSCIALTFKDGTSRTGRWLAFFFAVLLVAALRGCVEMRGGAMWTESGWSLQQWQAMRSVVSAGCFARARTTVAPQSPLHGWAPTGVGDGVTRGVLSCRYRGTCLFTTCHTQA